MQARNESAKKEVERSGSKVIAPTRAECEVTTRAETQKPNNKSNANRSRERAVDYESHASTAYVDPRSMLAQEQAADEFARYQTLKEVSEQDALGRGKEGGNQNGKGKGNRNNRNNRRRNDGKGKGGGGKGSGGKGGGANKRYSSQSSKAPKP